MQYALLAARLYGQPHLVTPEKAHVIEEAFRKFAESPALGAPTLQKVERPDLAAMLGGTRTQAGYVRTIDGMAVIEVMGPLMQRTSGLDAVCGFTSYQTIGAQISAARTDPLTTGVLLEIDSPGGESSGLFALASQVRELAAEKPVVAHANEQAFSAAYALAASAGELYLPNTGMVGSVGVIMMHVDQSQKDAKQGVKYTPIHAGDRKADFSPHAPLSDEALAGAQAMVDELYDIFVTHVAESRDINPQDVRNTEAGLLSPTKAIDIGMADGVASFPEAQARLRELMADRRYGASPTYRRGAAAANPKGTAMTGFTKEQLDAAVLAARTEGETAGEARAKAVADKALDTKDAEGKLAAAAAETAAKTRIAAIVDHDEAKGREGLAKHLAFNSAMTADEAVAMLKAAPKESKSALAARMANTNPPVGADAGAADPDKPKVVIDTAKIYAMRNKRA